MENVIGLKELRENMEKYAQEIKRGRTFIVFKKSRPLFRISPPEEEKWETMADFTKIREGGVPAKELLKILMDLE